MTPVRVNAEPILVEMRISAQRALDIPHPEAEDGADHVVNGIEFGDRDPVFRDLSSDQLDGSKGAIVNFRSFRNSPSETERQPDGAMRPLYDARIEDLGDR